MKNLKLLLRLGTIFFLSLFFIQKLYANEFINGKAAKTSLKFRNQTYELKSMNPIGSNQHVIGYSYEYLPTGQDFASWKNLITVQAMAIKGTNLDYVKFLYTRVKHQPNSIMEPAMYGDSISTVYLSYFLIARSNNGDGSVHINKKTAQLTATADLKQTKSDLITELNVNKLYRIIPDNTQFSVIYAERKYGKVNKTQFDNWQVGIKSIVNDLDNLEIR